MTSCQNCTHVADELAGIRKEMIGMAKDLTAVSVSLEGLTKRLLGNSHPGQLAVQEKQIRSLWDWKTAVTSQLRMLKWLFAAGLIPAAATIYNSARSLFSNGHP